MWLLRLVSLRLCFSTCFSLALWNSLTDHRNGLILVCCLPVPSCPQWVCIKKAQWKVLWTAGKDFGGYVFMAFVLWAHAQLIQSPRTNTVSCFVQIWGWHPQTNIVHNLDKQESKERLGNQLITCVRGYGKPKAIASRKHLVQSCRCAR